MADESAVVDSGVDLDSSIDSGYDESIDTEVTDEQVEQVESDVDQVETEEAEAPSPEAGSVKFSGKQVADAIKSASEQFPEQAGLFKKLKEAYFADQNFSKAFSTPQEAASVKQLIEDVGGIEGIESLQTNARQYQDQDLALKDGNPAVLEEIFTSFPEGTAKLAPAYLQKLAETNPKAYQNTIMPHAIAYLVENRVGDHLDMLSKESDPEKLKAGVAALSNWFGNKYNSAVNQVKKDLVDAKAPLDSRLTEREEALNKREQEIYSNKLNASIGSIANPVYNSEVDKYTKLFKLNDFQKTTLREKVLSAVTEEFKTDKNYIRQYQIKVNAKGATPESVGKFVADEFIKRSKDKVVDYARQLSGNASTKINKDNKGSGIVKPQTAKVGPVLVKTQPKDEEVNWNKTKESDFMGFRNEDGHTYGKAILRTGRTVTWKW